MRRQIPHLHILGHSLSNGCHGKLLHEMEFAASSLFHAFATLARWEAVTGLSRLSPAMEYRPAV